MKKYDFIDKQFLQREYVEARVSERELAAKLHCSQCCIHKKLHKFNIPIHKEFQLINLIGLKFGRLVVLDRSGRNHRNLSRWLCQCDCGKKVVVSGQNLQNKDTKSCGCLRYLSGPDNRLWKGHKFISGKFWSHKKLGAKRRGIDWNITKEEGNVELFKKYKNCHGVGNISSGYWGNIKRRAKKAKMRFELSIEMAWNLYIQQKGKCAITGLPISFARCDKERSLKTASLDRIDSSCGYINSNIWWVHKDINQMKWKLDHKYFVNLCQKIINHQYMEAKH